MKKLIGLLPLMVVFGCSSSIEVAGNMDTDKSFIENRETLFEVGSQTNRLGTIQLTLVSKEGIESKVIINFDELPFRKKLDLCPVTGVYQNLKKVTTSQNGDITPVYETTKVDCNSEIFITEHSDKELYISYDMNFLSGFNRAPLKGYEVLLPLRKKRMSNTFVERNQVELVDSKVLISLEI